MHLGTHKPSASEMKVLVLLMCAVAGASAGALAWPGAVPFTSTEYRTIIPGQVKGFGYSTSQYINAIPAAPIGYQPQIGYQISIPNYNPQPIVQPILGPSYFPSNNFLYPSFPPASIVPISPVAPVAPVAPIQPPVQGGPAPAEQPGGDEDTAVVDSAEFSPNQQFPQPSPPQPPNFSQTSLDTKNMPGFPQIPQAPQQIPSFPQVPQQISSFPQGPQQIPSLPQLPQFPPFPQAPQQIPSFPEAPQQAPSFPQNPEAPQQIPSVPQIPQYQPPNSNPQPASPPSAQQPSFFPGADNSNQGRNDEDTVSVESA